MQNIASQLSQCAGSLGGFQGGLQNACAPPKPIGEIPSLVEQVEAGISYCEKEFQMLAEKLSAVVMPTPSESKNDKACQSAGTQLGSRLLASSMRLSELSRSLAGLRDAVAL